VRRFCTLRSCSSAPNRHGGQFFKVMTVSTHIRDVATDQTLAATLAESTERI
ncbi:hypothetical protein F443_12446, partial [Phytophthora nicotianae P1569]